MELLFPEEKKGIQNNTRKRCLNSKQILVNEKVCTPESCGVFKSISSRNIPKIHHNTQIVIEFINTYGWTQF